MTDKEKYKRYCNTTYVPIYSKPWYMDAICLPDNWDVWVYETGGNVLAAMPYYVEMRGKYKYITKAPFTQTNGLSFIEDPVRSKIKDAELQKKVIDAVVPFIESLGLDCYEQQYSHTFIDWSPFYWHNFTIFVRYSYIIEDTSSMEKVWQGYKTDYRNQILKGQKLTYVSEDISEETFYTQYEKVFAKQNKPCNLPRDMWHRIYNAALEHHSGKILCSKDKEGNIHAILFIVWDERYMYHLMGGYDPEYVQSQGYLSLTHYAIGLAHEMGLSYDFEGSMIPQIAKSYRQFGGDPKPIYRVRKVFNPEIVRNEAENYIETLRREHVKEIIS